MHSVKTLIIGLCALIVFGHTIYSSDWFQKNFLYPFPYQTTVFRYAEKHNLDPYLVAGLIYTESKFKATAQSPTGARGVMQMMPKTADWVADQLREDKFRFNDLDDPEVSIRFGTWYFASVKKEFANNEILALAAYNGGRGNVRQWMSQYGWKSDFTMIEQIPFNETREYVIRVLANKKRYQELYGR
ncbi:MAG: Lytic transglycosylase catalytic [Firmicutes bacterium]|nr:Lytic transglycosylase catalytic [Bacillota bacterium]